MDCPNCGTKDLGRDEANVGIGIIYGPYGCECGWSEWEEYNLLNADDSHPNGYTKDQWGGLVPAGGNKRNASRADSNG